MPLENLSKAIETCNPDRLFVLTDENTQRLCLPLLADVKAHVISIKPDDSHKNLETVANVWRKLQQGGATRHSCLINLGGGMVTDLGGFAASTFKRGIAFINIPTTLLSMVDAAFGGKTGINFEGLKNEIGVFRKAESVIVDTRFLKTLDIENLLSGYAEMLKHALLSDNNMLMRHLSFSLDDVVSGKSDAFDELQQLVEMSIDVKERIVEADPNEKDIRKALNLGHTFGHAIESFFMKHSSSPTPHPSSLIPHPLLHGYAVAFGMVCELYLSVVRLGFPTDIMRQVVTYIKENYGTIGIECKHYDELISLMKHDKKNVSDNINCTLLASVGDIRIDQVLTEDEIKEAFDFLREG